MSNIHVHSLSYVTFHSVNLYTTQLLCQNLTHTHTHARTKTVMGGGGIALPILNLSVRGGGWSVPCLSKEKQW